MQSLTRRTKLLAIGLAVIAGCSLWCGLSGPVLLHTHLLTSQDDSCCGDVYELSTGLTVFNPIRSRSVEKIAEEFLRAAYRGTCSPGIDPGLCKYVTTHGLPSPYWKMMYRSDSIDRSKLYYRLQGSTPDFAAEYGGCAVAGVDLRRTAKVWKVISYGSGYGPYRRSK